MFQVRNLTNAPNQQTVAVLADGTSVTLKFLYHPGIQRWTVDVESGSFKAESVGLSTNPNLLRIWRNVVPFGLAVVTADGTDPFLPNDLDCRSGAPRVVVNMLDDTGGQTDTADAETASFT